MWVLPPPHTHTHKHTNLSDIGSGGSVSNHFCNFSKLTIKNSHWLQAGQLFRGERRARVWTLSTKQLPSLQKLSATLSVPCKRNCLKMWKCCLHVWKVFTSNTLSALYPLILPSKVAVYLNYKHMISDMDGQNVIQNSSLLVLSSVYSILRTVYITLLEFDH